MSVQLPALPDAWHFEACLPRGNMYCSQSRSPQDFVGCHLKRSPGTQHSDSPPRARLSQRYKSPTLLWVAITISSRFCFLVLFSFLFYLIDLRRERTAGHS